MPNVKTAISLKESLFAKADAVAHQLKISRSELFSKAMSEFLERRENRILLDSINRAVEDAPLDEQEKLVLSAMKRRQRSLLEGKW
jgi:metal-responsive CopG/Arc/MetJ family transcriptional regulator